MKKLLYALAIIAIAGSAKAQDVTPTFSEGDLVFNAGIGFGTSLYSGSLYSTTLPPLSISGEYGVADDFLTENLTLGVGGYFGIAGARYETYYGYPHREKYGWEYTYTVVGARGSLHYPAVEKLDTYAGLMLGYNFVSVKEFGDFPSIHSGSSTSSDVTFSVYIGGRYYFKDNLAAMMELGYGVAYLNLGLAFKI